MGLKSERTHLDPTSVWFVPGIRPPKLGGGAKRAAIAAAAARFSSSVRWNASAADSGSAPSSVGGGATGAGGMY
jgi:hypothetical protein